MEYAEKVPEASAEATPQPMAQEVTPVEEKPSTETAASASPKQKPSTEAVASASPKRKPSTEAVASASPKRKGPAPSAEPLPIAEAEPLPKSIKVEEANVNEKPKRRRSVIQVLQRDSDDDVMIVEAPAASGM